MAIPMKGEHTVTVGAGEFTLAFTLGACAAIEGQFPPYVDEDGKERMRGLKSILADVQGDDPKVTTLLIIIWAGLKKHHGLTLDEVGDLVTMEEAPLWGEAIAKGLASGSSEARGEANPRKAAKAR